MAMDESTMEGEAARKSLGKTQIDATAIVRDDWGDIDESAGDISALAVVPGHENAQEHEDDVEIMWAGGSERK